MKSIFKGFSILLAVLISEGSWSQDMLVKDPSTIPKSGAQSLDQNLVNVGASSMKNSVSHANGIEISSEQGSSSVTLKISGSLTESTLPTNQSQAARGSASAWSVTVQAPLSKGDDSTTLGTLDGLASGTTVEFKVTNLVAVGFRPPNAKALLAFCNTVLAKALRDSKDVNKPASVECASEQVEKYVKDPAALQDFYDLIASPNFYFFTWGLGAKGGYQDFTYYSSPDLSKVTDRKSVWSGQVFGSYSVGDKSLAVGSFQVQQAYKDATSKVLCPAMPSGAGPISCISGPVGVPADKKQELLTLEFRQAVSKDLAVSVSGTRDFKNKVSGVQVPIYLVSDGKSLTGGIRFDWSSDTHKTTAGIFIGQPFQLSN